MKSGVFHGFSIDFPWFSIEGYPAGCSVCHRVRTVKTLEQMGADQSASAKAGREEILYQVGDFPMGGRIQILYIYVYIYICISVYVHIYVIV